MNTRKCPRGTIRRVAYTRTVRGTPIHTKSACITDVGLSGKGFQGKGPGIGPLEEGELSKFGYDQVVKMTTADRRTALRKAVEAYGSLTVWKQLNARSIYTRNTSPASSLLFLRDRNWVKRTYGIRKEE
jgi:hypothetical protein